MKQATVQRAGTTRIDTPARFHYGNRMDVLNNVRKAIPTTKNIVLNFECTTSIDSSALGVLLTIKRALSEAGGGHLILAAVGGEVKEKLALTNMTTLFPMVDNVNQVEY